MAYTSDSKPSSLDTLSTLATDDVILVGDTNDSSRVKTITEANLDTQLFDARKDTSTSLGTSDTKFPTQNAVKTYIDTLNANKNIYKTFTAAEDLTAGQPVGISNYVDSTVGRAFRRTETVSLGITGEQNLYKSDMFCPIGANKFVFLNTVAADDSLYATVGSVDQDTKELTLGTPSAATADTANSDSTVAVCKLDTDKFIVFYTEDASATIVKYRVGTVSTTTISWGSAATFYTGATNISYISCDQISTDKGIVFIGCNTVTDSKLMAFTVSTTTATVGTAAAIGTTIDDVVVGMKVKKVGTDKFILVGASGGAGSNYAQVGTISGTTITLGSETVYSTTDNLTASTHQIKVVSPADDVVVILAVTSSPVGHLIAGTISATTPTFGDTVVGVQYETGLLAISSTEILTSQYNSQYILRYTRSGTGLSLIGTAIIPVASSLQNLLLLDSGYWMTLHISTTQILTFIKGMSNNFIGIAQSTVNAGDSVSVLMSGVDSNQTGLMAGGLYLISSGGISLASSIVAINTADDLYLAKALSATELLI